MTVIVLTADCVVDGSDRQAGDWLDPATLRKGTAEILIGSGLARVAERFPVPAAPAPAPAEAPATKKKAKKK